MLHSFSPPFKYFYNTTQHNTTHSIPPQPFLSQNLLSLVAPASLHQTTNKICVMDASGRLGSSLVLRLLQRGYFVHATLCNDHGNLQPLKGLSSENKNLRVFRADPFDYQSIVDALKGCSALFYSFEPPEDEPTFDEFLAEVEERAAHNVLEACAQTDTEYNSKSHLHVFSYFRYLDRRPSVNTQV